MDFLTFILIHPGFAMENRSFGLVSVNTKVYMIQKDCNDNNNIPVSHIPNLVNDYEKPERNE